MIRPILTVKNPTLRAKSREVAKIDKKVLDLVRDMEDTLKAQKDPEGVGLAAPQIGKNLRIFLISFEGISKIIINPKIIQVKNVKGKRDKKLLEGCLSLPHYYGPLKRSNYVKISYMDISGKKREEEFVGFIAQIVQHEIDHLEGTLFIDRLIEANAPLYHFHGDEWEEVELV